MVVIWIIATVILSWVVSLALSPVVVHRCRPTKAWGWLAVMFALPWLGILLYLGFGRTPLSYRRMARYREEDRSARRLRSAGGDHVIEPHLSKPFEGADALATAVAAFPPVSGNAYRFLTDQDQIVESIIEDIENARQDVHMVFYIWRNDEVGRRVAEALARAAARGVNCRVLADDVGARGMFRSLGNWMKNRGVEVRSALPLSPFRGRAARVDLRNHRKIIVVDGQIGYIGSWNVRSADFKHKMVGDWYDLVLRLEGPVIEEMQVLFVQDWCLEDGGDLLHRDPFVRPEPAGDTIMQVIPSAPVLSSAPIMDVAVSLIGRARRRIVMTTPYLILDEEVSYPLWLAAKRGVQVDVVVPVKSDSPFVDAATRSNCRSLAASGINIYMFPDGFLHAKTLSVDGEIGMVGSANWDIRSMRLDVEANVMAYDHRFTEQLVERQEFYIRRSRHVDLQEMENRNWFVKMGEDYAKLLSPLF